MVKGINIEGFTPFVQNEIFTQTSYIISDPRQPPGTEVIIISRARIPSKKEVLENIVSNARGIIRLHNTVLPRRELVWDEEKQTFAPAVVYMQHDNPVQGLLLETPYRLVDMIRQNLANGRLAKSCPAKEDGNEIVSIGYGIIPVGLAEKCTASDEPGKAYRGVMADPRLRRQGLGCIVNMQLKIKDRKLPEKERVKEDIHNSRMPGFIKYALERALNSVYACSLDDIENYSEEEMTGVCFVTLQAARNEFMIEREQRRNEMQIKSH